MNLDAVVTTGPGQPLSDNYCQTGSRSTCAQQPPQQPLQDLVDLCYLRTATNLRSGQPVCGRQDHQLHNNLFLTDCSLINYLLSHQSHP